MKPPFYSGSNLDKRRVGAFVLKRAWSGTAVPPAMRRPVQATSSVATGVSYYSDACPAKYTGAATTAASPTAVFCEGEVLAGVSFCDAGVAAVSAGASSTDVMTSSVSETGALASSYSDRDSRVVVTADASAPWPAHTQAGS
jgi:hypothetical protein